MPDTLTALVAAAMLALAIVWFMIISKALSDKPKAKAFFSRNKTPKDTL